MTPTRIPENINVVPKDLKKNTPAMLVKHPEGYTIVLNTRYSQERLEQALLHELKHLEENHFESTSADAAEKLVRGIETNKRPEPFFYFMYEGLAIGRYLKESYLLSQEAKRHPDRINNIEAKREVDAWIEELRRKERRQARPARTKRTPQWVIDTRKKLGL